MAKLSLILAPLFIVTGFINFFQYASIVSNDALLVSSSILYSGGAITFAILSNNKKSS